MDKVHYTLVSHKISGAVTHAFSPKQILLLLPSSFNPPKLNMLSITGRDRTGYTVHAGFCMFPQSCDLRTETAGSL
jgi:hypothetical protein